MKAITMTLEIEAPALDGCYFIAKSDEKWYVTMHIDIFRNSGQNAQEVEHPKGFASLQTARLWAERHHKKLSEQN